MTNTPETTMLTMGNNADDTARLMIIEESKTDMTIFSAALASAPPAIQKQMLREKLHPLVLKINLEFADEVTSLPTIVKY